MSPVVRRKRHPYARLQSTEVQLPDLVEIQLNSFKKFLDGDKRRRQPERADLLKC